MAMYSAKHCSQVARSGIIFLEFNRSAACTTTICPSIELGMALTFPFAGGRFENSTYSPASIFSATFLGIAGSPVPSATVAEVPVVFSLLLLVIRPRIWLMDLLLLPPSGLGICLWEFLKAYQIFCLRQCSQQATCVGQYLLSLPTSKPAHGGGVGWGGSLLLCSSSGVIYIQDTAGPIHQA